MKEYSIYKNSEIRWIGHIPESWRLIQLKFLTENHDNKRIPVTAEDRGKMQGQYPYYGATGIIDYVNNFLFDGEYLLIGEDGAPFFLPQDVAFVASGKFWVNNHAHILKCKNESNIHFLKYCLNSVDYVEYITGSTRDKLTQSDLCRIKLPIPSLPEQQVIADFLDHKTAQIDTLIEKKQKQIELLQEEHKALINHAITKGLNPKVTMKDSGVEWLDEIPSHWEFVKTKYLFRLVTEKAPDDNEMELLSLYTEIGVRPRKDLEARGNKASTTDGYWIVKEGDIVVNKLLAWMGAVGYSAYDGVTSPAYDILRKTVPLNSKFYHYLLRCGIVLPEFKRRSRGIMEMRLRLYFDELGQILLVYPPESEQNQIVEYLEDLEETVNRTISKITKEIELLQEYRMALIFESVTGKIDVRTVV